MILVRSSCLTEPEPSSCNDASNRASSFRFRFARWRMRDVAPEHVIVEVSGEFDRVERFLELLRPYGIAELARSGPVAMSRGVTSDER